MRADYYYYYHYTTKKYYGSTRLNSERCGSLSREIEYCYFRGYCRCAGRGAVAVLTGCQSRPQNEDLRRYTELVAARNGGEHNDRWLRRRP